MAGPRTHIEMGALAWARLQTQLSVLPSELSTLFTNTQTNLASFYCGCIFPDWGYDGINDDAAEDSHWPPFQEAFITVIQQRYTLPWEAEAERLLAFCLGVMVHGITDDLWHFSKDGHQCFLDMAKRHDHADHGPCEVACDVFSHRQYPHRDVDFWWPLETIKRVYASRKIQVTPQQLLTGFNKLEHEVLKGARWSWLVYPYYRLKYPWCHTHYQGVAYGAVRHGATAAAEYIQTYF